MENKKVLMNAEESFVDEIGHHLHMYNKENCEYINKNSDNNLNKKMMANFGVYENDKLIGGATGFIEFEWYFLERLWVDENYRGQNIGTDIIHAIEKFSKESGAIGIRTETWDFQAKGFYEKLGFKVYATFKDCPPGTKDYFLRKKLI